MQPEIAIPANAAGVEISPDGQVAIITNLNSVPQNVGQIQLVNFVNPAGLKVLVKNIYMPSAASGVPQQGAPGQSGLGYVAQGQL